MKWVKAGSVLLVEGKALHPGVFQGLDGHRIEYPPEVFTPERITFVGRQIKLLHRDTADAVVGFITGYHIAKDGVYIRGYVVDPKAIDEIVERGVNGFSIEARVQAYRDGKIYRAVRLEISAVAIVPNPAAPEAGVTNASITTLLTRLADLGFQVSHELAEEKVENASPKTLLAWIKQQLKKAKVEKEVIDKIMSVLEMVIPEDYPYPYPSPEEVEEMKAKNSELSATLEDLKKKNEEMQAKLADLEKERGELVGRIESLESMTLEALMESVKMFDPEFSPEFGEDWSFEKKVEFLRGELSKRLEPPKKVANSAGTEDVLTWLNKLWDQV